MSFSRVLSYIFTFGATYYVDKALESLESTIENYKCTYEEIKELTTKIRDLEKSTIALRIYVFIHGYIIRKVLADKELLKKLTKDHLHMSKELMCIKKEKSEVLRIQDLSLSLYDDAGSNIIFSAAALIPFIGVIGAHAAAREDIEQIQAEENRILDKLNDLYRIAESKQKKHNSLFKQKQVLLETKKVIIWYKSARPSIISFIKNIVRRIL